MAVEGGVAPGDVLAGYRVVALVGRGGAGDVYRARDDRLDRDVALKILTGPYLDAPLVQQRMLRESRLAASLDHPNVVPVYDAGEQDGQLFIAMRFVDGNDLAAELRRGPMSLERACSVAAQTGAALDAAHEQGLVHRDVKPSNVLVDRRGHCYLTDFGLSRAADEPSVPTEGALVGTVDYVAPEQVRGEDVDGRADVYSLGCMLYEMVTGEVPFRRPTDVATLFAHLQEDAPAPHRVRPDLPQALDEVLLRALGKDPDDRPTTCAQLVAETRDALGLGQPPRSRRVGLVVAAVLVVVALAVAAVAVALRPWQGPTAEGGRVGALVGIDARRGTVVTNVSVPGHPAAVAASTGGIWMADFRDGALWRFQPRTGALQRIASPGEPRDLAALDGDVYVASDGPKTLSGNVSRHDAATGVREDAVELLACALGSGQGMVWAAGCPFVQRLSTDRGPLRETRRVLVPFADPLRATTARVQVRELAVGLGAVWVLGDAVDRRLWRLDARTGEIQATVELPFPPRSVAVAAGRVWVTNPLSDTVVPVDPATSRVLEPVPVGRGAAGLVAAAGALWVAGALDGTVTEINPATGTVRRTITVGGSPHELAALHGTVWVTTNEG